MYDSSNSQTVGIKVLVEFLNAVDTEFKEGITPSDLSHYMKDEVTRTTVNAVLIKQYRDKYISKRNSGVYFIQDSHQRSRFIDIIRKKTGWMTLPILKEKSKESGVQVSSIDNYTPLSPFKIPRFPEGATIPPELRPRLTALEELVINSTPAILALLKERDALNNLLDDAEDAESLIKENDELKEKTREYASQVEFLKETVRELNQKVSDQDKELVDLKAANAGYKKEIDDRNASIEQLIKEKTQQFNTLSEAQNEIEGLRALLTSKGIELPSKETLKQRRTRLRKKGDNENTTEPSEQDGTNTDSMIA